MFAMMSVVRSRVWNFVDPVVTILTRIVMNYVLHQLTRSV